MQTSGKIGLLRATKIPHCHQPLLQTDSLAACPRHLLVQGGTGLSVVSQQWQQGQHTGLCGRRENLQAHLPTVQNLSL